MGPTEINMKHQNTTNLFRKHGIDTSGLSSGLKGKQTIFTQLLEFQDENQSQDPPVATPCRSSAVIPKARVMFSFFLFSAVPPTLNRLKLQRTIA